MAKYHWRDEFCVGNPDVDRQHKELFQLLDKLHDAVTGGDGNIMVGEVLEQLLSYTQEHFYQEEALLREVDYPELLNHIKEHEELVGTVQHKLNAFKQGDKVLNIELLEFINGWWNRHILNSDKRFAAYMDRLHRP
jgi:hemerythrin